MKTYEVTVTRDDRWWMAHIPELGGLTQARRLGEVESMAREWIAVTLDVSIDTVAVELSVGRVGRVEVADVLGSIRSDRQRAAELERDAKRRAVELAKALAAEQVPVRDIGAMMGISFQRAHQLIHA